MLRSSSRSVPAVALVLVLLAGGCGGDGGSDSATDGGADSTSTTSMPPDAQQWCEGISHLQGSPEMTNVEALEQLRELRAIVPSELSADLAIVIDAYANVAAENPQEPADYATATGFLFREQDAQRYLAAFDALSVYSIDVCGYEEPPPPEEDEIPTSNVPEAPPTAE